MAMRQYIGARYVPRFLGTYDPTQQYEALDVVDNGSGTSYIARKIVPAGTPLTDTEYWFVYGASSGAIIQLQNDMIQAQNDILGLQGDISDINANKRGNILVIGNSYVARGVCDALETAFDHSYEYKGDGIGFVPYSGHPLGFEDKLDDAITDSSFENNSITDIIFVSAVGDSRAYTADSAGYQTDFETVLASIKTKIDNNFPNARRRVITLAESRCVPNLSLTNFGALFAIHKIFENSSRYFGFEYIGWSGFINLFQTARFDADNYHPTTNGAKYIAGWLKTAYFGNADYKPIEYSETLSFKYAASSTIVLRGSFMPDKVEVSLGNISSTSGDNVTLAANDELFNSAVTNGALPAPWGSHNLYGKFFKVSTGADQDYLAMRITGDSNGCLHAVNLLTPTAATAASTMASTGVGALSYAI